MEEPNVVPKQVHLPLTKQEFINRIKLSVKASSEAYDKKFDEDKYPEDIYPEYPKQDLPITEVKWFGKPEKRISGDIQGFTALADRTALIVFRGTSKVLFESLTNIWPFKHVKAFTQSERKKFDHTREILLRDNNIRKRVTNIIIQRRKWDRRRSEEKEYLKIGPLHKQVEALLQKNPNMSVKEIIDTINLKKRKVTKAVNSHIRQKFTNYVRNNIDAINQETYDKLLEETEIKQIIDRFNIINRVGWDEDKINDIIKNYYLERLKRDDKIKAEVDKELKRIIRRSTVHSAYWGKYNSQARDKIHERISEMSDRFDDIVITGHSYGGALSILCAFDIWKSFLYQGTEEIKLKSDLPLFCIPFANLRPGSKRFAKLLNLGIPEIHRFIYGNDGFAKLLPPLFGFRNPGILYHIGPNKRKRTLRKRLIDHGIKTRYVPAINDPDFDIKKDVDRVNWDWEAMSLIKLYR